MFIKKTIITIAILTFFMPSSTGLLAREKQDVWVITSLDWQPYAEAEMASQGNSIQKLRQLLKKAGISLLVEFYPWKRAQAVARGKRYVGYFPAWPEEVKPGFVASPAIDISQVGIVKRSGLNIKYNGIDSLFKHYNVGVVSSYTYPENIEQAMKKHPEHVEKTVSELTLLMKLAKGRHPVAITDPNVMQYLSEKHGIDNVETLQVIMRNELVIAFRNEADNLPRLALLKRLLEKNQ